MSETENLLRFGRKNQETGGIDFHVSTQAFTPQQVAELVEQNISHPCVPAFHAWWYHAKHTWAMTRYKGVPILKAPTDLWVYQEMIWALKPHVIIETGTCFGGSALWFMDQLKMAHPVKDSMKLAVISIDITDRRTTNEILTGGQDVGWTIPEHESVYFLHGSSTEEGMPERVEDIASQYGDRVMCSLDSDHSHDHVRAELELYAPLVTPGQYLVVEDTNISGRPLRVPDDAGPGAAADAFLATEFGQTFYKDVLCERHLLTMHPGGWLRKHG